MGHGPTTLDRQPFAVPYSHMNWDDACLVYSTLNELLTYANARLGIVKDVPIRIDGDDLERKHDAARVGEMLWRNRWLIDEFVDHDPAGLGPERLALAAQWRHAVRATLTVMAADCDYVLYMGDDALFVVGAMESGADFAVHSLPSLALVTLLPFRGGIVVDGKIIRLSDEPVPEAVPIMVARCRELLLDGSVVSTAGELAAYCDSHPDGNLVPAPTQAWVDLRLGLGLDTDG